MTPELRLLNTGTKKTLLSVQGTAGRRTRYSIGYTEATKLKTKEKARWGESSYIHHGLELLLGRGIVVRPRQVLVDITAQAEGNDSEIAEGRRVLPETR
jgi:hypothetical protein